MEFLKIRRSLMPPLQRGPTHALCAAGGFFNLPVKIAMLYYKQKNKIYSRQLRSSQMDAGKLLWLRIRRKQINNIQFYRQKLNCDRLMICFKSFFMRYQAPEIPPPHKKRASAPFAKGASGFAS